MGECPKGQTCGPGLVCRFEHEGCTGATCGDDQYCSSTGQCLQDDDLGDGTVDRRSYVGRVNTGDQLVLGTLISPNVVATCSSCLGARSTMTFLPGPGAIEVGIRDIEFHERQDIALLILEESLAAPQVRLGDAAPTEGANYKAIAQLSETSERQSRMIEVDSMDGKYYMFRSPVCQTSGGPTVSSEDSSDVLIGVHATTGCGDQSMFADTAVVSVTGWIERIIEKYSPTSCSEVLCYGCSTCVAASLSCEPSNDECDGGTCNPDALECGEGGGGTCTGDDTEEKDDCAIRSCKESGTGWNDWTVKDDACGDENCTTDGNTFTCSAATCEADQKIPCLAGGCGSRTCDGAGVWGACEADVDRCPSDSYECVEKSTDVFTCQLK